MINMAASTIDKRLNRYSSVLTIYPSVLTIALVSLLAASLAGCASTKLIANADQLCKDWRELSVSKNDRLTQGTAAGIEASNEARKNWGCQNESG